MKRVLDRSYRAAGPESHGNHLVTDILISAGCSGHAGDHAPWDAATPLTRPGSGGSDEQPWDRELPQDEQCIVDPGCNS